MVIRGVYLYASEHAPAQLRQDSEPVNSKINSVELQLKDAKVTICNCYCVFQKDIDYSSDNFTLAVLTKSSSNQECPFISSYTSLY